jgi:predicted SAM-dependent methyltransferase
LDFSRTRFSIDRKLSSYSKIQTAIGHLIRDRRLFHAKVPPGAYVNLGCGPNILNSFVNVDYQWLPGLDICCDITRGIPIGDGIAGGIYSEHCLEHLTLEQCRFVLRECHRMLRPKATFRIVVPDLQIYARAYVQHLDGKPITLPNEYFVNGTGVSRPVALFNELFMGSGHRFIHDHETLSSLLKEAGFADVRSCSFGTGSDARLLIDTPGRASESLYVEATKD